MARGEDGEAVQQVHLHDAGERRGNDERCGQARNATHGVQQVFVTGAGEHRARQQSECADPQTDGECVGDAEHVGEERHVLTQAREAVGGHHQRDQGDGRHLGGRVEDAVGLDRHPQRTGNECEAQHEDVSRAVVERREPREGAERRGKSGVGLAHRGDCHHEIRHDDGKQPREAEEPQAHAVLDAFRPCEEHDHEAAEERRHEQVLGDAQQAEDAPDPRPRTRALGHHFTDHLNGLALAFGGRGGCLAGKCGRRGDGRGEGERPDAAVR